jgi:CRISPR/Cas system CSM-associated protein Csm3 (group 7 of RAMP superfamily)
VTVLGFNVSFHSPFRVGAAYASDGVAAALDERDPLPPDHLKGMMRAAAVNLLGQHQVVAEVFGSAAAPSSWSWSSATLDGQTVQEWSVSRRHRIAIDRDTHTARKDHLVLGEQAWAPTARFEVARAGLLDAAALAESDHVLVLRCAAAGVHGLGGWRRRGLGWVGITPEDGTVCAADVTRLLDLAGGAR